MNMLTYFSIIFVSVAVTVSEAEIALEAPDPREASERPSTSSGTTPEPSALKVLPLRLAIDLVDGSRIIGVPTIQSLPVQTSYAKMDIPLKQITSIHIQDDHERASIDLQNGDKFKGMLDLKPLELETIFGKIVVDLQHISLVSVIAGSRPTRGLVLHYSFDEDEGEKVSDTSGNSNDGTAQEAKWTVRGKRGGAYEFDGNRDYVEVSDGKTANFGRTDPFTLSAWVKLQPKTARDRNQFIVTKTGLVGRAYRGYYMLVLADRGDVPALCLQHDGSRYTIVAGSTDVIDGEWHHVVAVSLGQDGSASDLRLYVDGKKETVQPVRDSLASNSIGTPHTVRVGARHDTPVEANGTIDEVMIFSRALSSAEVRQLYASQR